MFDIGGIELMVIAVVALLVIGPERLPEALRTLGLWFGRLRRTVTNLTSEIEKAAWTMYADSFITRPLWRK